MTGRLIRRYSWGWVASTSRKVAPRPGTLSTDRPPAMGFGGGPADRQAHAHAVRLGGEERLEQGAQVRAVDARAAVGNADGHFAGRAGLRLHHQLPRVGLPRHGLAGVDQQVHQHLLKLHRITVHGRKVGGSRHLQLHCLTVEFVLRPAAPRLRSAREASSGSRGVLRLARNARTRLTISLARRASSPCG